MAAKKETVTLPEEEVRVEEEKVGEDLVPPLNIDPDNAEEPAGEAPEKDTLQDLVEYYKNRYPDNKTFHITSDGMFFLEKDLNLAYLHQRSLSSGEIKSVTV